MLATTRRHALAFAFAAGLAAWLLTAGTPRVLAQGLPYTFTAGTTASAAEVNANFSYVAPPNVVRVDVAGDGSDAVANGAKLLAAVDTTNLAALNGAPTSSNPYVVRVGPGNYDLDGSSLDMISFVSVVGAGERLTHITSSVNSITAGVINGATDAALQGVRVFNSATGGTHVGIYHTDALGEGLRVLDTAVIMANGGNQLGIFADGSNVKLQVRGVRVTQVISSIYATGIDVENGAEAVLAHVTVDLAASVGSRMAGISVTGGSTLTARDVSVSLDNGATSGSATYGVQAGNATVTLEDTTVTVANGDATDRYPLVVGASTVEVDHSALLNGSNTASDYFAQVGTDGVLRVGATKLSSQYWAAPSSSTGNSATCAQVYDASYAEVSCSSGLI